MVGIGLMRSSRNILRPKALNKRQAVKPQTSRISNSETSALKTTKQIPTPKPFCPELKVVIWGSEL